ncbi:MAG: SusD/RagB family nutrient-binding outer membrane lipoprotein [Candidatus Symbiothrix sp.]|jgi:hypothetical protein|nr:SusD/RagB family nutrient-binding outer membrane lipoprotein [Candidatus Symbiothrix sp.]
MKKIYQSIIFLVAALFGVGACTDNFEEINTRPDRVTATHPDYIFGLTTVKTLRELTNDNNWFFFGNYTNQWSVIGGSGPHFGFDGRSDRIWNNLYTGALNPLFSIINNPEYAENPEFTNRIAIAKIWRSYVFSQLVGLYGPLPYTDACNGQATIMYDKEEDVYRGILNELKEAYEALKTTGDKYPENAEPFLKSDIRRWGQFAHCIRLRTAIRLTEVPEEWAPGLAQEARDIVKEELSSAQNLISDNSGNFFMKFGEKQEEQNPLYRDVISNSELVTADPGNFPVIHESLVLWMSPDTYDDPCLDVYMTKGSGGTPMNPLPVYLGRPHSMESPQDYDSYKPIGWSSPYEGLRYKDFATVGKEFSKMTANFYFFSYAELCFIRAEAAYKGYWGAVGNAQTYYYNGIDARCTKYISEEGKALVSTSNIEAYKKVSGIAWDTESDTVTSRRVDGEAFRDYLGIVDSYLGKEDNFKRIIVQHWISLFAHNIDNYTLLRRTEVIPFKPHFGVDQNNGYVDARYGYTPERIIYPGTERSINKKETYFAIDNYLLDKGNAPAGQQDQVTYRLIYAKDNPGLLNPGPVYTSPLPNMARNRIK